MALGTNQWKLGLFVIVALGVAVAAAVMLGVGLWNQKTIAFVSYFDESVQGLELGSPVKYRGVTVGRVAAIEIAKDLRHVEVTSELSVDRIGSLNLVSIESKGELIVHPDMRVQLAQTGITGVKFILIDFFDAASNPVVPLPFEPPPNYVPTAPSMMKNLEDSILKAADRVPEIANDAARAMTQVRLVAEQIEAAHLPDRANQTLTEADRALAELTTQLQGMDAQAVSAGALETLDKLNLLLARSDTLLERLEGEEGLIRVSERGAVAIGEVARGARTVGPELELTLREVRGAARSIKRLADTLERDPDMLLKGRAQ